MQERMHKLLIVDDEQSIREFLEIMLQKEGYEVVAVPSAKLAFKELAAREFDLLLTDISMPEFSGIELLTKVKQSKFGLPVILMTAFGSTEKAVEAMKLGAADYINKPFKVDDMKLAIATAIKNSHRNREKLDPESSSLTLDFIKGRSPQMIEVFDLIERISTTRTNVMILGESGTGKELVANAIHNSGKNKNAIFIAVNCAAVPEALFESELFGHKKGSFTGAIQDKDGIFKQADGGTLFLDEVGDVPLSIQVKMLRAIQQKTFRPLGGKEDVTVNTRIICATNKNLEEMVAAGTFREDLYYRLNVIQIKLPALRDRKSDIPLLANHFLSKFTLAIGKNIETINEEAMNCLCAYSYPGNIRELENIIERAVALEPGTQIHLESLPEKLQIQVKSTFDHNPTQVAAKANQNNANQSGNSPYDLTEVLANYEKQHILNALNHTNGVKKKAAKLLGITFRSLRYRIEKYGISDPNPDESE